MLSPHKQPQAGDRCFLKLDNEVVMDLTLVHYQNHGGDLSLAGVGDLVSAYVLRARATSCDFELDFTTSQPVRARLNLIKFIRLRPQYFVRFEGTIQ